MNNKIENSNNKDITFIINEIEYLKKQTKDLNLIINKKEDDLKNIINEKDITIKEMNVKILKQENIIENNKLEISDLKKEIQQINNKLNIEFKEKENKINENKNEILNLNKKTKEIYENFTYELKENKKAIDIKYKELKSLNNILNSQILMNINNMHINPSERDKLDKKELIEARKNGFLLFGKTGSGKTTLLNAI